MSDTGTCSNCRALYKKCKYNYARQTHCTKEDCQGVRHRNNNIDYNRRERERLEEERLLREVQRAEKLGLATSKKTQENPVSRDEFEQLNEVLESAKISLSGLLVLLQGFAAKMTSDEAHTQTVDFARSFLRECYDVGQSLFPALEKKLNLQDILYDKTNPSAGKAKSYSSKFQLAGSSLGP
jgi:hypothetical protein